MERAAFSNCFIINAEIELLPVADINMNSIIIKQALVYGRKKD